MATTIQARTEAVKSAMATCATCTAATVVVLKDLLGWAAEVPEIKGNPASKIGPRARTTKTMAATLVSRPRKYGAGQDEISTADREVLAVHIINLGLKALLAAATASQPQAQAQAKPQSQDQEQQPRAPNDAAPAAHQTLRRSSSAPLSPLKPRPLNRTATMPPGEAPLSTTSSATTATGKHGRSASVSTQQPLAPSATAQCLATVECVRVALQCAKRIADDGKGRLGRQKIESAMLTFIERLVKLGMQEQAVREIRSAKRWIGAKRDTGVGFADVFDFAGACLDVPCLNTVGTLQLHALQVLNLSRKAAHIEEALPFMRESNPSSPINIFARLASSQDAASAAKTSTKLQFLSKWLIAISPSLSSSEDAAALEPRLCPSPATAFELQELGLRARLHFWRLAQKGGADVEKDVMVALGGCVRALLRRTGNKSAPAYRACVAAFENITAMVENAGWAIERSSKSGLANIIQCLGTASGTMGLHEEAARWNEQLLPLLDPSSDSMARRHLVTARILTSRLRQPDFDAGLQDLLKSLLDGLQGPLNGSGSELDDLLGGLSPLRLAAVRILVPAADKQHQHTYVVPQDTRRTLESLVVYYARFVRRWLGTPPSGDTKTREFVKYEQRRRLLATMLVATVDSVLRVVKDLVEQDRVDFNHLDEVLQDCEGVLADMADVMTASAQGPAKTSSGTHHVRISSLYTMKFQRLYSPSSSNTPPSSTALRCLRRSIDAVMERSCGEKQQSLLTARLERYADLCKQVGRIQEARDSLQSICSALVEDNVLANVSSALAHVHPCLAWQGSDKAARLSRALCSIFKLDKTWVDWTCLLPELERAAVLEHLIYFIGGGQVSSSYMIKLSDPPARALLDIYSPARFPVRRLRALLHLYTMNAGDKEQEDSIRQHIDIAIKHTEQLGAFGEDKALSSYATHLRAHFLSADSLVRAGSAWPTQQTRKAFGQWASLIEKAHTREDLESVIDHPAGLLAHLKSVGDFASMRGESMLLLGGLELAAGVSRILATTTTGGGGGGAKFVVTRDDIDAMVSNHSALAARYVDLGYPHKASETLERVKAAVQKCQAQGGEVSRVAVARYHLGVAEYMLGGGGSVDKAEQALAQAKSLATSDVRTLRDLARSERGALVALASCLLSRVSLEKGEMHQSLSYVKHAVQIFHAHWGYLESKGKGKGTTTETVANTSLVVASSLPQTKGPEFWALAYPFLQCLAQISSLYAHLGLFKETVYYAERAKAIAEATRSRLYQSQVSAWMSRVWVKAAKRDDALRAVAVARDMLPSEDEEPTAHLVTLAVELSDVCRELGEEEAEGRLMALAEEMAKRMESQRMRNSDGKAIVKTAKAAAAVAAAATTTGRGTRMTATKPSARKTTAKLLPASVAEAEAVAVVPESASASASAEPVQKPTSSSPSDARRGPLLASILIHRALSSMQRRDWASALDMLRQAKNLPKHVSIVSQEQVAAATALISQSMELMIQDPVFSVIPESAISFPSICASSSSSPIPNDAPVSERVTTTAAKRGKAAGAVAKARACAKDKAQTAPEFLEALKRAQEYLLESHAIAISNGDGSLVHRISTLLQGTAILLSATSPATFHILGYAGYATCSIELARNITWRRESKSLLTEKTSCWTTVNLDWPTPLSSCSSSTSSRRSSLGFMTDMAKFQRDYIAMIPKSWSVISMSLTDNQRDLCITKLQAEHSPLVIRIPLVRGGDGGNHDGREGAGDGAFSFERGLAEMTQLVHDANETSHGGGLLNEEGLGRKKGSANEWWARRRALDNQLGNLLARIEADWLCGFRGIFSHHKRRAELLARFQNSLDSVLDKHLPSRRSLPKKKKAATAARHITLDPRILDLFIGLGDPSHPDADLHDALEDLIYFVVDVLQFNGERNAYDEIDFDSMVVDTLDALHAYHDACAASGAGETREDGAHGILILDNVLNAFPWESMPCMRGLAVSRVPSLACLKRLILEQQQQPLSIAATPPRPGHFISRTSGTYILNPSSDLSHTLQTFAQSFSAHLPSWTPIVSRVPTETEFETALTSTDLLLYFGHGSGAQYIRSKTLRKLDKCRAVAFLMGCSSAALPAQGEFESAGPARNYLLAGCPAVVGALWDVTDRDIDKFATRVFDEWGLLGSGNNDGKDGKDSKDSKDSKGVAAGQKKKDKGKKTACADDATSEDNKSAERNKSLVEAVAAAKDSNVCKMRYLNAAAVVVYGIPVYLAGE